MMKKQNRILIYSQSSGIWGGGQIYIEQLCNYMNDNGLEVYVLTSEPETFSCSTKEMDNAASRTRRLLSAFKLAVRYRRTGFNVIVLNDLASLWLAPVFKLFGFKTISLLHLYLQRKCENKLGHSDLEYNILKLSAYFCDRIFSVNNNNQKVFVQGKVEFIGNYVPDWFIEKPLAEKQKTYDFIIVSRLSEQKNIPLFIQLLRKLLDKTGRQYNALIVGAGPDKERIQIKVAQEHLETNVDFLKWVDRTDLPNVYDRGKCFVISSHHEGFATTLLEAHARGIPALVTRSSGFCGEYVEGYNSVTGIVFERDDLGEESFYLELSKMVEDFASYHDACIEKAKIFSSENVLGPILKACDNK